MNWEETIKHIRTKKEHRFLVEKAYLDEDLALNIERFIKSDEFSKTLEIIKHYAPNCKNILDIGCGNGISCISFALKGYNVTAVEPDPSETVGSNAIIKLKQFYKLKNINVINSLAENLELAGESYDIVYSRQAMHHANNLENFIYNTAKYLKKGGVFMTIRDHVIFNEKDKRMFLNSHPLHKFYGGENAFRSKDYENAFKKANLSVLLKLKHFDSVINFFPESKKDLIKKLNHNKIHALKKLKSKISFFIYLPFVKYLFLVKLGLTKKKIFNEKKIPGRMYSYILEKK